MLLLVKSAAHLASSSETCRINAALELFLLHTALSHAITALACVMPKISKTIIVKLKRTAIDLPKN